MQKIVINKCYGGFGLSAEALLWLWDHGVTSIGKPVEEYYKFPDNMPVLMGKTIEEWLRDDLKKWKQYLKDGSPKRGLLGPIFTADETHALSTHVTLPRDAPMLVACVETLGDKADGPYSELVIVEIPDDVEWTVEEYDGQEWVAEKHRTWS